MKTTFALFAFVAAVGVSAPAVADTRSGPGALGLGGDERVQLGEGFGERLRIAAEFNRARAAELRKLGEEDERVGKEREASARSLEAHANTFATHATHHRDLAAKMSGADKAEQLDLQAKTEELAREYRASSRERTEMAGKLLASAARFRAGATNLDAIAARQMAAAGKAKAANL